MMNDNNSILERLAAAALTNFGQTARQDPATQPSASNSQSIVFTPINANGQEAANTADSANGPGPDSASNPGHVSDRVFTDISQTATDGAENPPFCPGTKIATWLNPGRIPRKLCKVSRTTGYTRGVYNELATAHLACKFLDGVMTVKETWEHTITAAVGERFARRDHSRSITSNIIIGW